MNRGWRLSVAVVCLAAAAWCALPARGGSGGVHRVGDVRAVVERRSGRTGALQRRCMPHRALRRSRDRA
jgi:hypothetical protein